MSKSNSLETAYLQHLFQNANIANVGDATGLRGSTTPGNLYFGLHTADPGEAGNQTTNEIVYTGYARVGVSRNGSAGFTVTGNAVATAAATLFGTMTAGAGGVASHWSVGTDASGAGTLLYKGALSPTINVVNGVAPQINAGTAVTED